MTDARSLRQVIRSVRARLERYPKSRDIKPRRSAQRQAHRMTQDGKRLCMNIPLVDLAAQHAEVADEVDVGLAEVFATRRSSVARR